MTLLLLAGTGEARVIAAALAKQGITAIASLAGATRQPAALAISTRIGGYGDAAGFRDYLHDTGITAVLDATHPFADRMSHRSAAVAAEMGLPYAQFLRPEWHPGPGDNWVMLGSEQEAADHIPLNATVFLATGRQTLGNFGNLTGRRLFCRQIDPPEGPFPFPGGEYRIGRPPFSVEDEVALFRELGIDWLVVKNAGGVASRSKLDAARLLELPVAMIRRPAQPDAQRLETVEQAMRWVRGLPW
ncbi:MAG: cobalt-precorrin-6A reductase [Paracoccaceae bacterium]